jgi:2-polyprenyl-3-methyl-5-hydroxy-6-metoxy-1,4-benzoquinol methylase
MSQSLVQRQFGAAAADYAASAVHASGPSLARLVAMVGPQPDWQVLDVATGAGHMALALAPLVARVVASDITEEMLTQTAKLAAARQLKNVETAHAEAGELAFAAASFDLVTCRLAAHHFPDPRAFVVAAWRVLKPGGTFALVDNVGPDAVRMPAATPAEIRDADTLYNTYEELRDPSHARALGLDDWLGLLTETGFVDLRHEQMDQDIAFKAWTDRMRCDAETVERLEHLLDNDLLRTFLRPRDEAGERIFMLQEAVIVARKPGRPENRP